MIQENIQFCQIKYLYSDILIIHCVWSLQVHTFKFIAADISRFWSLLGILGPFAFSVFLFCHPFGGRDSLKKRKILEESG